MIDSRRIIHKIIASKLVQQSLLATIDQALLSALNFFISIILLKTVPKIDYGYYSIAMPVLLFCVSLQNAVVNTPLTVLLVSKSGTEKKAYVEALFHGQVITVLPCLLIISIGVKFCVGFGISEWQIIVASAVCFAALGVLYREFMRSYLYAEQQAFKVLKLDLNYVCFFFLSLILLISSVHWSVVYVFILIGAWGMFVSWLFGYRFGWQPRWYNIKRYFAENWALGKWALLGVCVTHIQNYCYLYLLGFLLGGIAVADVSAARLLLMPLVLLQIGWSKIIVPHASRLHQRGEAKRFLSELIFACGAYVLGLIVYVLLLKAGSNLLLKYLLTEKYRHSLDYVLLWGAVSATSVIAVNAMYGLQVIKKFKAISITNVITMVITVVLSYVMIRLYGITGSLIALCIGNLVLGTLLWTQLVSCIPKIPME